MQHLGITGDSTCKCPNSLAAASVRNIIQHLVDILELEGRRRAYDEYCGVGNPAVSVQIKGYLKRGTSKTTHSTKAGKTILFNKT